MVFNSAVAAAELYLKKMKPIDKILLGSLVISGGMFLGTALGWCAVEAAKWICCLK